MTVFSSPTHRARVNVACVESGDDAGVLGPDWTPAVETPATAADSEIEEMIEVAKKTAWRIARV